MRDYLTVVSGLPRSGTSMMMGALLAGGLALITDEHRSADYHNPLGYFEHQSVKNLEYNPGWLYQHKGSVIKILFHKLQAIPSDLPTRVLFMERDLIEVIASQNTMLGQTDEDNWVGTYQSELEKIKNWLASQNNIRSKWVSHRLILSSPQTALAEVADFLDGGLDLGSMVRSIKFELYREKSPELGSER